MKIITIVGARPQFIKSAPVSLALKRAGIEELVVHTGQHYDERMSSVFFEEMGLPKPYKTLQCGNLPHVKMVAQMLIELEPIISLEKPDYILVYGDTNSTLAGALTASKLRVPIIHVEAGLRSHNLDMPEEMNRILTDRMASILFTPTQQASENLVYEGFDHFGCIVEHVGDVMLDAMQTFHPKRRWNSEMGPRAFFDEPYVIATVHRFENVNHPKRLKKIVDGLNAIHNNLIPVWMPIHPSTQKKLDEYGLKLECQTAPPASYFEMLFALENSTLVLTDSGGLQKEAYFTRKPCITLRSETEWVELISLGVNQLANPEEELDLVALVKEMFAKNFVVQHEVYGSGDASDKIAKKLLSTKLR